MGLFKAVSDKLHKMRQHAKDRKQFFDNILQAVQDGHLTDAEMDVLTRQYTEFGITEAEFKHINVTAFMKAYNAAKSDGVITSEEFKQLKTIQTFLKIPDDEIKDTKRELARLRLLNEIQLGHLPTITASNVIMQNAEVAHWEEPAKLLEQRVIDRHYEGGSQGVSIRIMRGVSYRVGAQRGHLVSETGIVPVSHGNLVLTNKRAIFLGDAKSFNLKLDKILSAEMYNNGIKFADGNGKNKLVQFDSHDNSDIIGAIISQLINRFQS
jgi:hypothetical protein